MTPTFVGHVFGPAGGFPGEDAVFRRVRIPASRPSKSSRNPIEQKLTFAFSWAFRRFRLPSLPSHFAASCRFLGSAFGHIFAPVVSQASNLASAARGVDFNYSDGPHIRDPARPLRDPRAARRGRDGRGVPRSRYPAVAGRRSEGPANRSRGRSREARPLRAG